MAKFGESATLAQATTRPVRAWKRIMFRLWLQLADRATFAYLGNACKEAKAIRETAQKELAAEAAVQRSQ